MIINYILGSAYVFVTYLIWRSYRNQTKILQEQSINQKEQNEIMKAQTTALQLQANNLQIQNNLLEKQLKLSSMEKLHLLEKIREEQMKIWAERKVMGDPRAGALYDRLLKESLKSIEKEIEEIKKIQRESEDTK